MIRRAFLKTIGAVAAGLIAPFKAVAGCRPGRRFFIHDPATCRCDSRFLDRNYPNGSTATPFEYNDWHGCEVILPPDRWGQRLIVLDVGPEYPTVSHFAKARVDPHGPGRLPVEADYPKVRRFLRQEFDRAFGPYRTWRGPREFDAHARRDPRFKPWRGQRSDDESRDLLAGIRRRESIKEKG